MKTLLLAAAVVTLGFSAASAENRKDSMHDMTMQNETMRDRDHGTMKDSGAQKQADKAYTDFWQRYSSGGGGGG